MRKPGEIVVGCCFLAVGVAFTIGAVRLQIGGPTEPLPGFFPFWGGLILMVLSVLYLFHAWGGRAGGSQTFGRLGGIALVVGTLILYVATLEKLGYLITTGCLCAVILKVLETKLRVIVAVSLVLPVASYLIFDRLLGVTLPPGLLTLLGL
jgi:putative tricarboxylic transport membrane protein